MDILTNGNDFILSCTLLTGDNKQTEAVKINSSTHLLKSENEKIEKTDKEKKWLKSYQDSISGTDSSLDLLKFNISKQTSFYSLVMNEPQLWFRLV
jgi:hypothetical protein